MQGWIDGCVHEWMAGWLCAWTDGCIDGWKGVGRMAGWIPGWTGS
jgi:hypothetical protein